MCGITRWVTYSAGKGYANDSHMVENTIKLNLGYRSTCSQVTRRRRRRPPRCVQDTRNDYPSPSRRQKWATEDRPRGLESSTFSIHMYPKEVCSVLIQIPEFCCCKKCYSNAPTFCMESTAIHHVNCRLGCYSWSESLGSLALALKVARPESADGRHGFREGGGFLVTARERGCSRIWNNDLNVTW